MLVSTYPSVLKITPEPVPWALEPATEIVTTEGDASAATAVMTVASAASLTVIVAGLAFPAVAMLSWLPVTAQTATPAPDTPPTSAPTTSAATSPVLLKRRALRFLRTRLVSCGRVAGLPSGSVELLSPA